MVLPQREDLPDEGAAVAGAGRGLAAAHWDTPTTAPNIATPAKCLTIVVALGVVTVVVTAGGVVQPLKELLHLPWVVKMAGGGGFLSLKKRKKRFKVGVGLAAARAVV